MLLPALLGVAVAQAHEQPKPHPRFLDKDSALDSVGTERQRLFRAESALPRWASGLHVAGGTPRQKVLHPSDFGADPTGQKDSLPAFEAVLKARPSTLFQPPTPTHPGMLRCAAAGTGSLF